MRKFALFLAFTALISPMWGFLGVNSTQAVEKATIDFFFSETCPHCSREEAFLDDIGRTYGDRLQINRYSISERGAAKTLEKFADEYGARDAMGAVPITFVGDNYYVGFDSSDGIGQKIVESVEAQLTNIPPRSEPVPPKEEEGYIHIPFLGSINPSSYSLPGLAILLGALDGFNVCSLGALILILGLTLELKSRKKIVLYGSIFLITTAIIYGVLIQLWYQLFSIVQGYLGTLSLLIGILGIIGGIYFFREFIRMRRVGMVCKTTGASFVDKVMKKTEDAFSKPNQIFYLILAILIFAVIIAIVEFPCSAAIPVAFAGIMVDAGVSGVSQFFLLSLFIFFYLIDEVLIFAFAVWQMRIALTSPNLTIWATFAESIFLFGLGAYYLLSLV